MKRAILLSRVSTQGQDLIQQNESLYKYAATFGYTADDCILIAEKESGIRLSELERRGLNRLKETIETTPTIECCFAYEISRIGRKSEVNYSIRRFLQDHHVQLRIQDLNLKAFNEQTWELDEQGNMLFSIFNALSENEFLDKKSRMLRGKARKRELSPSLFNGGAVVYGYKTQGKDKQLVVDEETAPLVRRIFDMYVNQCKTTKQIALELLEQGCLWHTTKSSAITFINLTLRNVAYRGSASTKDNYTHCKDGIVKYGYVYPQLLSSPTIWDKAAEIRARNSTRKEPRERITYIAKGLVYWQQGRHKLSVAHRKHCYSYNNVDTGETFNVNMNMIESLAWAHTLYILNSKGTDNVRMIVRQLREKQNDYIARQMECDRQIAKAEDGLERINKMYVNGRIEYDAMVGMQDEKNNEISELKAKRTRYVDLIDSLQWQIEDTAKLGQRDYTLAELDERKQLANKYITRIDVEKGDTPTTYNIDIDGTKYTIDTHYKRKWIIRDGQQIEYEYIQV